MADVSALAREVQRAWDKKFTSAVDNPLDYQMAVTAVETVLSAVEAQPGTEVAPGCRCAIGSPSPDLIPPACPVHGVPCEECGGVEGCAEDCGDTPAASSRLTCNGCLHAPATLLAVMGRTNADRTPAPGHVLRLLCADCAGQTREICERGGRAVTFLAVADVTEAIDSDAATAAGRD